MSGRKGPPVVVDGIGNVESDFGGEKAVGIESRQKRKRRHKGKKNDRPGKIQRLSKRNSTNSNDPAPSPLPSTSAAAFLPATTTWASNESSAGQFIILQHNCNKQLEVNQIMSAMVSYGNDTGQIALLQEPLVRMSNEGLTLPNVGTVGDKRQFRSLLRSLEVKDVYAAIIGCDRTFESEQVRYLSNGTCVVELLRTRATDEFSFYAVSAYFHPDRDIEDDLDHLQVVLDRLKNRPVLIGLDANAEHASWSGNDAPEERARPRVRRGQLLYEFIQRNGLYIENNPTYGPTFVRHGKRKSFVDVSLTTQAMHPHVLEWQLITGVSPSDHKIIRIVVDPRSRSCGPAPPSQGGRHSRRFDCRKADWGAFKEYLQDRRSELLAQCDRVSGAEGVEILAQSLADAIKSAAEASMPRRRAFVKRHRNQDMADRWKALEKSLKKKLKKARKGKKNQTVRKIEERLRKCLSDCSRARKACRKDGKV